VFTEEVEEFKTKKTIFTDGFLYYQIYIVNAGETTLTKD
jgi:hypothetical protein